MRSLNSTAVGWACAAMFFVALAPASNAQWNGPGTPPGGGGFVSTNGGAVALSGGVTHNFTVTQVSCTQLYYGATTATAIAAAGAMAVLQPLTYDPTQTTPSSAIWTGTVTGTAGAGHPGSLPVRFRMTSLTTGVTILTAPGPIGGGGAVAAIPQDVTSFSLNLAFEGNPGAGWAPFGSLYTWPQNSLPPTPICRSEITGGFFWYTAGPCASVTVLPSNCGVSAFSTTPFRLGTSALAIVTGLPNQVAVIVYSIGPAVAQQIGPCTVYIDLLTFSFIPLMTNGFGFATFPVLLPFIPALAGAVVTEQAGVINPAAPLGIDISNANQLVVGY